MSLGKPMAEISEARKQVKEYYRTIQGYHDLIEEQPRDTYVVPPELLLRYINRNGLVLDVAGGSGSNASILGLGQTEYVCVDFSFYGLTLASAEKRAMCVQADVAELPIRDESVDCVLCSWSFEHMAEPEAVLGEMSRVLKPGGRILMWGPNWDNIFRKDFPQFAHKKREYVQRIRWEIFLRIVKNEFLPFRYNPYINLDVAALADPKRYISGDSDAVHCVLCQETYKALLRKGMRIIHISDFSEMGKHLRNDPLIRTVRRVLTLFLPLLRQVPLVRWFVIRFPIVVEKPVRQL